MSMPGEPEAKNYHERIMLALERIAYGMLAQTEEANGALTARWE